jgi:hypothetical protein
MDPRDQIPIACDLTALNADQRVREGVLLQEHHRSFVEMRERDDGWSFRYTADLALFGRIAELVALEHRCCPFLDFQLDWLRLEAEPWLHITGGARVKEFVANAFGGVAK